MHGLINRSVQCFLRDTYGAGLWAEVAQKARLGFSSFEPMLSYDAELTDIVITTAMAVLGRSRETLLEDMGTYLVSHRNVGALRRLLRFGGVTFVDFLHSMEDLPERGRLALPDIDLPTLRFLDHGGGVYGLSCSGMVKGVGYVVVGLLRAMADEYGALVLLEHAGMAGEEEMITIQVLDHSFAEGRRFELAMQAE